MIADTSMMQHLPYLPNVTSASSPVWLQSDHHLERRLLQSESACKFGSCRVEGPLTAQKCDVIMHDVEHKLFHMWASKGWDLRFDDHACWDAQPNFWEQTLRGDRCHINWFQGTIDEQVPRFSGPADALLGFDESIYMHCLDLLGRWHAVTEWSMPDEPTLARTCIAANQNILRLHSASEPWNMCQNLRWMLCALRGKLHGQRGSLIHFAAAPKHMKVDQLDGYNLNHQRVMDHGMWRQYKVSDVFFSEVCILSVICSNPSDLFAVKDGEPFHCHLDDGRFRKFASWMSSQHMH